MIKTYKASKGKFVSFVLTLPGVYLFKDETGKVIYVGKAKNLKNRLSSYFVQTLLPKTRAMINAAYSVETRTVDTEIEALLLEAKLVRSLMPKYNIQLRDDKSPLYIVITKDKYPRILSIRKNLLSDNSYQAVFGPFLNSGEVRSLLNYIRSVAPYSDHLPDSNTCIYSQIGLCKPCPSVIEKSTLDIKKQKELRKEYLLNIRIAKSILNGNIKILTQSLSRDMKNAADQNEFEKAGAIRDKLTLLKSATTRKISPEEYLANPNLETDIRNLEIQSLKSFLSDYIDVTPNRIECFDIAHLGGSYPTASMVTFVNGEAYKQLYRHFKIKKAKGGNDTESMREVISRRIGNNEKWGVADLVIVDGGKPQVGIASELLGDAPLIGLAKRYETVVIKTKNGFIEKRLPDGPAKNLLVRIRDESHRFARNLHHKLLSANIKEVKLNAQNS